MTTINPTPGLVTVEEAAEELGVWPRTVRRWLAAGAPAEYRDVVVEQHGGLPDDYPGPVLHDVRRPYVDPEALRVWRRERDEN